MEEIAFVLPEQKARISAIAIESVDLEHCLAME